MRRVQSHRPPSLFLRATRPLQMLVGQYRGRHSEACQPPAKDQLKYCKVSDYLVEAAGSYRSCFTVRAITFHHSVSSRICGWLTVCSPENDAAVAGSGTGRSAVWIHQLSKRHSQAPFRNVKGTIQKTLFHPSKPHFFVAVRTILHLSRHPIFFAITAC
jgi:hypothetical protein